MSDLIKEAKEYAEGLSDNLRTLTNNSKSRRVILALLSELSAKDEEILKLQKKIHNQRVALRENWMITESRNKPWQLKTMAKWHVENKELKATNQRLEAENEINNEKIRVLGEVVEDIEVILDDGIELNTNNYNDDDVCKANDGIILICEALNQLENKP